MSKINKGEVARLKAERDHWERQSHVLKAENDALWAENDELGARLVRLHANVAAVRERIGECPMPSAGHTAVTLLEQLLERHDG